MTLCLELIYLAARLEGASCLKMGGLRLIDQGASWSDTSLIERLSLTFTANGKWQK